MKKLKQYLSIVNTCVSFAFLGYCVAALIEYFAYRGQLSAQLAKWSTKPTADQIKGTVYEVLPTEVMGIIFAILIIAFGVLSVITAIKKVTEPDEKRSKLAIISSCGQVVSGILLAVFFFGFVATFSSVKSGGSKADYSFLFPLNVFFTNNVGGYSGEGNFLWVVSLFASMAIAASVLAAGELVLCFVKLKGGAAPAEATPAAPVAPIASEPVAAVDTTTSSDSVVSDTNIVEPVNPVEQVGRVGRVGQVEPVDQLNQTEAPAEPVVSEEPATPVEPVTPAELPTEPVAPVESTLASAPVEEQPAPVESVPVEPVAPVSPEQDAGQAPTM